jgi:hypothetical protein
MTEDAALLEESDTNDWKDIHTIMFQYVVIHSCKFREVNIMHVSVL